MDGNINKRLASVIISAAVTLLVILVWLAGVTAPLERLSYDLLFRARGTREPSRQLVLVTIDEKSARDLSLRISQWPRRYLARAVETLADAGADLVVLDLDLSREADDDDDRLLAGAIETANNVILARYVTEGRDIAPLPAFRYGEVGEGFIDYLPDPDGVVRGTPLVSLEVEENGTGISPYLSMPLEAVRLALYPGETPPMDLSQPDLFRMGDIAIPYPGGKMAIDYAGPAGTYARVHFSDLIEGRFDPASIDGRIVMVGNTHPAYHDYFLTPLAARKGSRPGFKVAESLSSGGTGMSGIEVMANAADTIFGKSYIKVPGRPATAAWLLLAGAASCLIFVVLDLPTIAALAALLGAWASTVLAAHLAFKTTGMVLPAAATLLMLTISYLAGVAWHRVVSAMEKAMVTRTFGHYVSHQVVDRLLKDPALVRLGGEKREMTVLFSDARGFTALSEGLDPGELVNLVNEFHTAMTEAVFRHDGVLDKYIGDALMAFYGAPIETPDHAHRACLTALAMSRKLDELNRDWSARDIPSLEMGIGVNTGPMVVGNMGSDMRFDYTVMGDSVNLGSRIESANKLYGTRIIISRSTFEQTGDRFLCRPLDTVRVRGRNHPVDLYELMGDRSDQAADLAGSFTTALETYSGRRWDEALRLFEAILKERPEDGPSRLYTNRCRSFLNDPPASDWDGVHDMKGK